MGGDPGGGRKIGCSAEPLRNWVRQVQRDADVAPGLSTEEQQRLKSLERENRELKRANENVRKASAYFAQAELDRRPDMAISVRTGQTGARNAGDAAVGSGARP